eukprot:13014576-Alexandrium_andersonii.AAC.1
MKVVATLVTPLWRKLSATQMAAGVVPAVRAMPPTVLIMIKPLWGPLRSRPVEGRAAEERPGR